VCTNRKSAAAERGLRALGATLAMGIPVMRRSKHSRQGVFSGTIQIPVDSSEATPGGGRMVI
jgi:hypothetical protein